MLNSPREDSMKRMRMRDVRKEADVNTEQGTETVRLVTMRT